MASSPPPANFGPPPPAMPQQHQTQNVVLMFMQGLAAPIALYSDNPQSLYDEIRRLIQQANHNTPKLIEKVGMGPLKKVSFLDTHITGVAMQAEMSGK